MGSNFQLVPLEDVVTIHDAKRKPITKADRKSGVYPYYGASDIADYIDDYIFDGVYLLLSEDGDNLRTRNTPIAFIASGKFWVNNHAHVLQGQDEFDTIFLCYALRYAEVDSYISGSTRPKITQADLKKIPVFAPELNTRRQIAKFVKTFDDKITLNRQINQTLEQMAQALFKSWFVDFDPVIDNALDAGFFDQAAIAQEQGLGQESPFSDELLRRVAARVALRASPDFATKLPAATRALFPAAFELCDDPALGLGGWVPKGWNAESLENVTSLIIDHRGKTPKKLGGDWSEIGHPAISAKNIKNGRLVRHDTIRYVDSELYTKWMKDPLLAGDILMTSEAPLGELLYLVKNHDYLLSQRLYGIRANKKLISGCFLYFWLQTNIAKADIDGRATGTTVVGIRQSELKAIKVMTPQKIVIDAFTKLTTNSFEKIESNEQQSIALERIRNELLPKLISGELRLDDLDTDLASGEAT